MARHERKPAPTIASFDGEPNSYPLLAEGIQETMQRAKERIEVLVERINIAAGERDALQRMVSGAMYALGHDTPQPVGTSVNGTFYTR